MKFTKGNPELNGTPVYSFILMCKLWAENDPNKRSSIENMMKEFIDELGEPFINLKRYTLYKTTFEQNSLISIHYERDIQLEKRVSCYIFNFNEIIMDIMNEYKETENGKNFILTKINEEGEFVKDLINNKDDVFIEKCNNLLNLENDVTVELYKKYFPLFFCELLELFPSYKKWADNVKFPNMILTNSFMMFFNKNSIFKKIFGINNDSDIFEGTVEKEIIKGIQYALHNVQTNNTTFNYHIPVTQENSNGEILKNIISINSISLDKDHLRVDDLRERENRSIDLIERFEMKNHAEIIKRFNKIWDAFTHILLPLLIQYQSEDEFIVEITHHINYELDENNKITKIIQEKDFDFSLFRLKLMK